jgi:hypothetical protein
MNCAKFKIQIDSFLSSNSLDLPKNLMSHFERCDECAAYFQDVRALKGVLDDTSLEVRPGELDDITFDQIKVLATEADRKPVNIKNIFSLRWIWVPAVASAAALLIFLYSAKSNQPASSYSDISFGLATSGHDFEIQIASSDSLSTRLLSSLAANDADLDKAADVLIGDTNLNDLLNSLNDDELKTLYNKIDNLKG